MNRLSRRRFLAWGAAAAPLAVAAPALASRTETPQTLSAPPEAAAGPLRGRHQRVLHRAPSDFRGQALGVATNDSTGGLQPAANGGPYESPVVASDFPFSALALSWQAAAGRPAGGGVELAGQTSADGQSWSAWYPLWIEIDAEASHDGHAYTTLLQVAEPARFARYRLTWAADGPPVAQVGLVFISVEGASPSASVQPSDITVPGKPRAWLPVVRKAPPPTPIPVIPGPGPTQPPPSNGQRIPPPIDLPRSAWGADESLRLDAEGEFWWRDYFSWSKLVVHHTATGNDVGPLATIQNVYYYHTVVQGWGDIGYHALIGADGKIYEGRKGRDNESPGSDHLVAGHVYRWNYGSMGVALMGDFSSATPSSAMQNALVKLGAWFCNQYQVDPTASDPFTERRRHTEPKVKTGKPNLPGHRDCSPETDPTSCPGNGAAGLLPTIRNRIKAAYQRDSAPRTQIIDGPDDTDWTRNSTVGFTWAGRPGASGDSNFSYQYFLEGRDAGWPNNWTTSTAATFNNLPDGFYVLHVRARDSAGRIDPVPAQRSFWVNTRSVQADNHGPDGTATSGDWPFARIVSGFLGADYQYADPGGGARVFTWALDVPYTGRWAVDVWYTTNDTRASNAPYTIYHAGAVDVVRVNQRGGGGQWHNLGESQFNAGWDIGQKITLSNDADGVVVADSVRLRWLGP